uniref:Uncharacterized protein n=1 Tax=Glossina brevipalpis TaxID=37001 RepID=A0A1A9WHA9_9MUSC
MLLRSGKLTYCRTLSEIRNLYYTCLVIISVLYILQNDKTTSKFVEYNSGCSAIFGIILFTTDSSLSGNIDSFLSLLKRRKKNKELVACVCVSQNFINSTKLLNVGEL